MSSGYSKTGVLAAVGLVSCAGTLAHLSSLLWVYIRPSSLSRYLHTTDGKPAWALVTGATGGIGKALSHELAARGFNVVLHGRSPEKLRSTQAELEKAHPDRAFRTIVIDASKVAETTAEGSAAWASAVEDINLTVLINNAGGATERTLGPLDVLSSERFITDTCVNALFPALLIRELIPQLRRNGPGLIINIGSIADLGLACSGTYSACKTYLMKLTEVANREMRLAGDDIEVLGIRVGNVWGTGQTVAHAQDIFAPDATAMAKGILARVGCGKHHVAGYWSHALQLEAINWVPGFILEHLLMSQTKGWNIAKATKSD